MMVKKRKTFILKLAVFLFLGLTRIVLPEEVFDPEKKIPVELLQEDFCIFRTALEEGHAGLYQYAPKEEMDAQFERIFKQINRPLTELEFFHYLAYLIAAINDGHTSISFSKSYDEYLAEQPILLPFALRIIHNRVYLFRNYSEKQDIKPGGRILYINGRKIFDILGDMTAFVPGDGHIKTSRHRRLERTILFGRLFYALFGQKTDFMISYLSPEDGLNKDFKVKGLTKKELDQVSRERYPEIYEDLPPIELNYQDKTAILTIRTFSDGAYRREKVIFPLYLKKAFNALSEKGIQNLIIDLRDNGGGADLYGKLLCSYLIPEPYLYYYYLRVSNKNFSFLKYTDTPNLEQMLEKRLKPSEQGWYELQFHPNLGLQKPLNPHFAGKVYVMINGNSFSGSGETTSIMHYQNRAVFIGEECGAGYYGNTSGIMPVLTLPHSKMRVRIPMVRYVMAVSGYPYPDRGIIPEFPFTPTIGDLLAKKDTMLNYVLELIRKKDKK
ncbi:MAG: hypothetical protein JXB26_19425 [Candidatus Aminicenantes bacterium]|nr:hypothetical protein [Candidatus Aminicenantes bacterium]